MAIERRGAVVDDRAKIESSEETAVLPLKPALPETEPRDTAGRLIPIPQTAKQIHRAVWKLAWPSVLTMLLQTFNGLMDTLFVGHLPNGKAALAATGIGGQVLFLLISLAMGVSVGTTALVSRFTGAQEPDNAVLATGQSLSLGAILGLAFTLVFFIGRTTIVGWMFEGQGDTEAAVLCNQFLLIVICGTVPLFLINVLMGAFRGIGDTRTPMLIQIIVIATHITGNWLLIYGHFGLPKLGVRGAGTALTLSMIVGAMLYLTALYRRSPLARSLSLDQLRLRSEWCWRILKIGIPASFQAVIRSLGMLSFTGMLAHTVEASASVAAMNVGLRAEAIAFMPGFGYSVAASTLVGQSLGANDTKRAEQCGWAATWQGVAVMAAMALVFFSFAYPLARLFTSDPLVQHLSASYLRICAFGEPFLALGMVLTGALQGAGDTIRPTYITIFTTWIVRVPLGYWMMFRLNMQTTGAWYAMALTTIIGGILTVMLFRSGRWKQTRV